MSLRELSSLSQREQHRPHSNDLVQPVSPGSESRADADRDHPGTWEILPTPTLKTGGDNGTNNPRPRSAACCAGRGDATGMKRNRQYESRYRDVKETERPEKEGKKS